MADVTTIGPNVKARMQGTTLVLEVETKGSIGDSKSGKNVLVASTKGNARIGDLSIGVNVFRPKQ